MGGARKVRLGEVLTAYGAEYVRSRGGGGSGGATGEDWALCAEQGGPGVESKAGGGIADLEVAEDFVRRGGSRLGTRRVVKGVKALEN